MMPAAKGEAMQPLVRLFIDIALHRKGPQDVPAAGAVLGLALLAYIAMGAATLWPSVAAAQMLVGQLTLDLLLTVVFFGGLLALTGKTGRVRQTLAALFGTGALLSAIALPFVWVAARALADGAAAPGMEGPALLSTMALFMVLLASLLVTGHIMRHALDWNYAAGVLTAVAYFAVSVGIFRRFFTVD
jgi:cellobiose-specific phosphotransferase system component IIC